MIRFVEAIRKSIENENWFAALYMSMAVPDMCASLESDDGQTKRKRYMEWYERYLAKSYQKLSSADCYALRCAILHEGSGDISQQRSRDVLERFHFTVYAEVHLLKIDSILQLDAQIFCDDICRAAERWIDDFRTNHPEKRDRLNQLVTISIGSFPQKLELLDGKKKG
jgi:hypothetical protein